MYMPKLGTMPLRNRLACVLAISLLIAVSAWAQTQPTTAPGAQPNATQTQGQPQGSPAQNAPAQSAPAQGSTPAQTPASPSQGQQTQPGQGQPQGQQNPGQSPQGPSANDNGVFVFHATAQEVTLHATVVDERNRLITNLAKGDFAVFENSQPQQIRSFRQEDIPVAMGIVIDNSGSMREKREEVNKAAVNLVKASNPDDQVFVVNFSDEYYLDQEFTPDVKKLQAALEHVESRGGTALYDAIVASADYLTHSRLQRKAIFVVTDGEDDASQETLEQAVHKLQQENGPVVYSIGLLGEEKSRRAKRALEVIADRTGGISFFPPTLDQVDEISREVAHDIRNQYTITYAPSTPKTVQGYRTIHVDARSKPYRKLTVRTRTGYYPGQEQQGNGGSY